jgi:hypothetical protein
MLVAVAWIAIGAAGYFLFNTQQKISNGAASLRGVDQHAREAADALADLRVGQQAYVASGQGVAFWMPKVAGTADAAGAAIGALRKAAASADAQASADQASAALAEFIEVDKRARDYVRAGQMLMAGDVIFTEGGQLAAVAARQVEAARLAEHQAFDASEAAGRRQQAIALATAAGAIGVIALLLGATGHAAAVVEEESPLRRLAPPADDGIVSHARPVAAAPPPPRPQPQPAAKAQPQLARNNVVLRAAADLATDFGRVRDSDELGRLLGRAADLIDASGLIVWVGDTTGSDLRPVLSHGYGPQVLGRMTPVPRTADNAAAAAYRTGALQIVLSKPGSATGAIVAPILGVDGCTGALSAEIRDGGEGSEAVQAVTTIVAAHLATVLAAAPADSAAAEEPRAAAQG